MTRDPPREHRTITSGAVWVVLGNTLALIALLVLLWKLRTLVAWTLIALLLALAAYPVMDWLTRHGFKRGLAVLVIVIAVLGVLATLVATVVPIVVVQGRELVERAPDLLGRLEEAGPIEWLNQRVHIVDSIQNELREWSASAAGPAIAIAGRILHGLAGIVTVLALTSFMLLFGDDLLERGFAFASPEHRAHYRELGLRMKKVVGGYVLGSFVVASIGGVVIGLTTLILEVPYFVALALVMIVLGLIPFLGSAIAAVLIVGVTLTSSGTTAGIIVMIVYLIYQQIENHVLHPIVQRHTIRMNPLLITLALLAGAILAGILGTLLALPIAGVIQVILQDALSRRRARWAAALPAEASE